MRNPKFANNKFGFNLDGAAKAPADPKDVLIFEVSVDLRAWMEIGRVTLDRSGVPESVGADSGSTYTPTLAIQNGRVEDTGSDPGQTTRMYRIRKTTTP